MLRFALVSLRLSKLDLVSECAQLHLIRVGHAVFFLLQLLDQLSQLRLVVALQLSFACMLIACLSELSL